jgi:hypothetical protein
MSTSKIKIKGTGRRRGTVPLKKVRQAVAAAFAEYDNDNKRSTRSTAKGKAARKRS